MLRASSQSFDLDLDLQSVKSGPAAARLDSGVPAGKALLAWTEAVLHCDLRDIPRERDRVIAELSQTHAVEAAGVMGAFVTGDLFNLYVWFEVMLIASFGLLVLGGGKAQLDGGIKYVALNLVSTALFLAAIGLLYGLTGTIDLADGMLSGTFTATRNSPDP